MDGADEVGGGDYGGELSPGSDGGDGGDGTTMEDDVRGEGQSSTMIGATSASSSVGGDASALHMAATPIAHAATSSSSSSTRSSAATGTQPRPPIVPVVSQHTSLQKRARQTSPQESEPDDQKRSRLEPLGTELKSQRLIAQARKEQNEQHGVHEFRHKDHTADQKNTYFDYTARLRLSVEFVKPQIVSKDKKNTVNPKVRLKVWDLTVASYVDCEIQCNVPPSLATSTVEIEYFDVYPKTNVSAATRAAMELRILSSMCSFYGDKDVDICVVNKLRFRSGEFFAPQMMNELGLKPSSKGMNGEVWIRLGGNIM